MFLAVLPQSTLKIFEIILILLWSLWWYKLLSIRVVKWLTHVITLQIMVIIVDLFLKKYTSFNVYVSIQFVSDGSFLLPCCTRFFQIQTDQIQQIQ